jgi:hypothetical protein
MVFLLSVDGEGRIARNRYNLKHHSASIRQLQAAAMPKQRAQRLAAARAAWS